MPQRAPDVFTFIYVEAFSLDLPGTIPEVFIIGPAAYQVQALNAAILLSLSILTTFSIVLSFCLKFSKTSKKISPPYMTE